MSKDTLKKFLDSAAEYPDNTPITIGDQQIPLGSLRSLNSDERQKLTSKLAEVEAQKAELGARQQKVVELATKAQAAYDAAEEARRASASAPVPKTGEDPFSDPWLAPVKNELDKERAARAAVEAQLKTVSNTIVQAATIFAEDRWDRDYAAIDFGKREQKPTRQELLDLAAREGLKDRHGLPSIEKAWHKLSEPDRIEAIRREAMEKGREEGRMQTIASRVPPPGVAGPGQAPALPKSGGPISDLGDLYAEALKDPELRSLVEQAGAAGIM